MKSPFRFVPALALALACAVPAFAQESDSPSASQPWKKFEKQLGLQTTYSVDMVMQTMGMNMTSRTVRDGDKSRTEMTMPFMNLKMVALETLQDGRTVSYTLFPDKKKYVLNEDASGADAAGAVPQIEELGTETFEGEACVKRRITMVEQGIRSDMIMLFSPKQKNMPVKLTVTANAPMGQGQPAMPIQSVVLFKNYDFSTPDASQFAVPAGFVQAASMQEVMMEGMDLGAMMQQMQQMQPAEE